MKIEEKRERQREKTMTVNEVERLEKKKISNWVKVTPCGEVTSWGFGQIFCFSFVFRGKRRS